MDVEDDNRIDHHQSKIITFLVFLEYQISETFWIDPYVAIGKDFVI